MLINNRIYNIDTNSRHWAISLALIVILSVIMTFIPFVGLCLSLMFFRQRFAPILFIIFSFYFGWFYEPQMDLLVHYEHFHRIADKSLVEQWMDSGTSKYGKEIYPVLFKYFIGLIADNRNFSLLVRVWYILLYLYLSRKTTPAIIYAENVNSCMATLPGSDFYCRILLVSRFSLLERSICFYWLLFEIP